MKVGFSTVAGTSRESFVFHNPSANIYRKLLLDDGRIVGVGGRHRPGRVRAGPGSCAGDDPSQDGRPRWRQMLHGERINYGMLAYESAGR